MQKKRQETFSNIALKVIKVSHGKPVESFPQEDTIVIYMNTA